ncbi:hypothetical protein BCR35DRAFT_114732 [Leucosporidium creatinivorum]|uniref:Uncharacterized protein n=1 Tax=Leucosporidium creatinivorum TaxID=106004 RepID=A0A1Y2F185_9BASI|nr:hypothetical protein BCR35DRAFT_114732 [Leucosporidium creatinivorum]
MGAGPAAEEVQRQWARLKGEGAQLLQMLRERGMMTPTRPNLGQWFLRALRIEVIIVLPNTTNTLLPPPLLQPRRSTSSRSLPTPTTRSPAPALSLEISSSGPAGTLATSRLPFGGWCARRRGCFERLRASRPSTATRSPSPTTRLPTPSPLAPQWTSRSTSQRGQTRPHLQVVADLATLLNTPTTPPTTLFLTITRLLYTIASTHSTTPSSNPLYRLFTFLLLERKPGGTLFSGPQEGTRQGAMLIWPIQFAVAYTGQEMSRRVPHEETQAWLKEQLATMAGFFGWDSYNLLVDVSNAWGPLSRAAAGNIKPNIVWLDSNHTRLRLFSRGKTYEIELDRFRKFNATILTRATTLLDNLLHGVQLPQLDFSSLLDDDLRSDLVHDSPLFQLQQQYGTFLWDNATSIDPTAPLSPLSRHLFPLNPFKQATTNRGAISAFIEQAQQLEQLLFASVFTSGGLPPRMETLLTILVESSEAGGRGLRFIDGLALLVSEYDKAESTRAAGGRSSARVLSRQITELLVINLVFIRPFVL